MSKLVVVALGGNALLRSNQKGTYQEQIANVTETCQALTDILKRGNRLIIGHGNGPQVGNVMLQHEAGLKTFDLPAMPMDFCVSETQGSIGYLVELGFKKVLAQEKIDRNVVTLITQVVVDQNDPMFQNPTKPVGPYYTKEEAEAFAKANSIKVQNAVTKSYVFRTGLMMGSLVIAFITKWFNPIATLVPLAMYKPLLYVTQFVKQKRGE